MRVLVVDDTAAVRERLVSMIAEIPGITAVAQAEDGAVALEAIRETPPQVVVLDITMPRINGFEVLTALTFMTNAPISIVVSNHADYGSRALQAGACFFFDKSTELDALMVTLATLADGSARTPC